MSLIDTIRAAVWGIAPAAGQSFHAPQLAAQPTSLDHAQPAAETDAHRKAWLVGQANAHERIRATVLDERIKSSANRMHAALALQAGSPDMSVEDVISTVTAMVPIENRMAYDDRREADLAAVNWPMIH